MSNFSNNTNISLKIANNIDQNSSCNNNNNNLDNECKREKENLTIKFINTITPGIGEFVKIDANQKFTKINKLNSDTKHTINNLPPIQDYSSFIDSSLNKIGPLDNSNISNFDTPNKISKAHLYSNTNPISLNTNEVEENIVADM